MNTLKRLSIALLLTVFCTQSAWAAASMTFAYDDAVIDGSGNASRLRKITVTWVSSSGGSASGTTRMVRGRIIKGVTVPAAAGSAPTDNYDINITDEQSVDVLVGCKVSLINRDTANTEEQYFDVLNNDGTALTLAQPPTVANALTVSITNAGDTKGGTIVIYYEAM